MTLRGTSVPVIENQIVYSGFANGKVVALDIVTGSPLWEMNIFLPEGGTELRASGRRGWKYRFRFK